MKNILQLILLSIVIIAVIIMLGFSAVHVANWQCDDIVYPDLDAKYSIIAGQCMIYTEQGWIPEGKFMVVP